MVLISIYFPDNEWWCRHLFICLLTICMASLKQMSIQVFCPLFFFLIGLFVFLVLNCVNPLYILYINPLPDISFASIFSHLVDCLFILLMVSFAAQKLISLIRSRLFIFALISLAWGDRSKKIWPRLTSKSGFLCFLLGVVWFQALCLGFKPPLSLFLYVFLYPLGACFCVCCEAMLQVRSFTHSCAVFSAPLLKGLSSPHAAP